ncbi:MAG: PspC domain-containing protein [Candidatus Hydrogenedens sp.]|nr:PspC domain-containing protein [Candidatus Hydrogenedens sp.]
MRHERNPHCNRPYRSRHGRIFGVCKGLADYWDVNVRALRICAVLLFFVTGFWPLVIGYVIAALLMKPEPMVPITNEADAEFYSSFTTSKVMALHRLKRTFDNLDRRIQRIESIVTAKEYDWDCRLGEES